MALATSSLDTKAILAAVKAKIGKIETYKKYDLAAKLAEYEQAKDEHTKAAEALREIRHDINGYLEVAGMPLLTDNESSIPQADLITKLEEVMPAHFASGGNGKELANAIGLGVTTNDIAALYWTDKQTTLKKAKDGNGNVLIGLKTRYLLAAESDLDEINKDKEKEKAARKAQKSATSSK